MAVQTGDLITANRFNDVGNSVGSSDMRIFKNIRSSGGTITVNATDLFGDISFYSKFEAYAVMSGTFSASHWGRVRNTAQTINKVTQDTKGVFKVSTTAGRSGWGGGSQSSMYFDLVVIGDIVIDLDLILERTIEFEANNAYLGTPGQTPGSAVGHLSQIKEFDDEAKDGIYWIKPSASSRAFPIYCKFDEYGSWALVWSNIRGRNNTPTNDMNWANAVSSDFPQWNTNDRFDIIDPITNEKYKAINGNLHEWEVYTPLSLWDSIANNQTHKLRYTWSPDVTFSRNQDAIFTKTVFDDAGYTLRLSDYRHIGTSNSKPVPGLWDYHNNRKFSTHDVDNDAGVHPCGTYYGKTPWWYGSCWSGSINGGGDSYGNGYYPGAYWYSSCRHWGVSSGHGAGSGWMWIGV